MIKLSTFLKKEYIKLLKKLETINIDCFFCNEKNVKSFANFSKCESCEINNLQNKDMNWFLDQLKENWPIINYYPKVYFCTINKNDQSISINFYNKNENINIEFNLNQIRKKQILYYFYFLNYKNVSYQLIDYFQILKKEVDHDNQI